MAEEERPSNHYIGSRLYVKRYIEGRQVVPGNCGLGQLTTLGYGNFTSLAYNSYQQHFANGRALQSLYVLSGDLPSKFNASVTYVRSTDKPRTFASAEALLFGLYPQTPVRNYLCIGADVHQESDSCFSNLVINTGDYDLENMTPNVGACSLLQKLKADFTVSSAYKNYMEKVRKPLQDEASSVFGLPDTYDWAGMFDCLQGNVCHNHTLPTGRENKKKITKLGVTQSLYDRIIKDHFAYNSMLNNWLEPALGSTYAQIAMGYTTNLSIDSPNLDNLLLIFWNALKILFKGSPMKSWPSFLVMILPLNHSPWPMA